MSGMDTTPREGLAREALNGKKAASCKLLANLRHKSWRCPRFGLGRVLKFFGTGGYLWAALFSKQSRASMRILLQIGSGSISH